MLVMLLAEMFPEDEGQGIQSVPWDSRGEYHVSNLRVFVQLKIALPSQSEAEWVDYLRKKDTKSGSPHDDDTETKEYSPDFHMVPPPPHAP
jgi:hypothetical protein